jgi:lysophospholipase L1-like esterase
MPAAATMRSTGIRQYFTDHYTHRIKKLGALNYRVIDAKEVFEQSNVSISELFYDDDVHFTSSANKLIAKHLAYELNNIKPNID